MNAIFEEIHSSVPDDTLELIVRNENDEMDVDLYILLKY